MFIRQRKILDTVILISIIFIVSLSLVSGFVVNQNPCSQCHGNISEYCRLKPTGSSAVLPLTIPKGSISITMPIEITGSGANNYYRIITLQVTLKSNKGNIVIQNPEQTWTNLYPGGKIFFTTTISGSQEGTDTLLFSLSALNSHNSAIFTDSYSYEVNISSNGSQTQQPAVEPSTQSLYVSEKQATFQLLILRDIQNLIISTSKNITVTPSTIATAQTGQVIDVVLNVLENTTIEDTLMITWNEQTENQQTTIFLSYVPPDPPTVNYYSFAGRVIGILSLALLVASIVLSGINKKIRTRVNSYLSPKKRMQIHCYLSWILLAVSVLHGILLLLGPYANFLVKPEIILGYFTALSMFIVSVNGTFRTRIINIIGSKLWRRTHGYYSYIALILCIIHAYLIGTEFEILRSLL